jgi:hypothetical protein
LFLLKILKFWIKELNLTIKAKKVLLDKEGWFIGEHLDTTLELLNEDILKYARFQECEARLDKAKHAPPMNKPCFQFYHIHKPRDWFLLYFLPHNESHYQCFVYDTLGFHDLYFGLLQNIGISHDIRIQQRHLHQQEDGFSCGPLIVAMAIDVVYQINSKGFIYNMLEICKHLWNCFKNQIMITFPKLEIRN